MSSREPLTVSIYAEEATLISNWTLQYPTIETGGDLFGLWESESNVVVQLVLGPGKKSRRTRTSFFQDEEYLSQVGGSFPPQPEPAGAKQRRCRNNMEKLANAWQISTPDRVDRDQRRWPS